MAEKKSNAEIAQVMEEMLSRIEGWDKTLETLKGGRNLMVAVRTATWFLVSFAALWSLGVDPITAARVSVAPTVLVTLAIVVGAIALGWMIGTVNRVFGDEAKLVKLQAEHAELLAKVDEWERVLESSGLDRKRRSRS